MLHICKIILQDSPWLNTTAGRALFAPDLPAHYSRRRHDCRQAMGRCAAFSTESPTARIASSAAQTSTKAHTRSPRKPPVGALLRILRRSRKTVCKCMDMAYVPLPTGSALFTCHPARLGQPPDQAAQTEFAGRAPGHPRRTPSSQLLGRRAERRALVQDWGMRALDYPAKADSL